MTRTRSTVYLILTLLCISLAIVAMLAGCDEKTFDTPILGPASGSGPIGGGETQKIRLTASPSGNIPTIGDAAATATITALVENNIGQAVPDGTAVYWSTTIGTLNSTSGTSSNGSSEVTLTFPKNYNGCSTVTAESGDAKDSIRICTTNSTPTPTVTETPTPSTTFIVSSSASTIAHGGTCTITAYAATNGVADTGMQVTFSVSNGGALSANADTTDANGNAQVTFTGNNTSSGDITATITATTTDGRSGTTTVIVTSGATPTPTATPAVVITDFSIPAQTAPYIMSGAGAGTSDALQVTVERGGFPATGTVNFSLSCSRSSGNSTESSLSSNVGTLSGGIATTTFTATNSSGTENETCSVTATIEGQSAKINITVTP